VPGIEPGEVQAGIRKNLSRDHHDLFEEETRFADTILLPEKLYHHKVRRQCP